jgi:hypothetical protein
MARPLFPCRKLTFSNPEGSERAGRPSLMWLDSVEKALRTLGIGVGQEPIEEAKDHTEFVVPVKQNNRLGISKCTDRSHVGQISTIV